MHGQMYRPELGLKQWITHWEAAAYLEISPKKLTHLRKEGIVPGERTPGKNVRPYHYRYWMEDLFDVRAKAKEEDPTLSTRTIAAVMGLPVEEVDTWFGKFKHPEQRPVKQPTGEALRAALRKQLRRDVLAEVGHYYRERMRKLRTRRDLLRHRVYTNVCPDCKQKLEDLGL